MILVTGGAGYIGSHVNKLLSARGYDTLVYDSLVSGHKEFVQWGEFIRGELSNRKLLDRVFELYEIDAVIHFAAFTFASESLANPARYYRNNVVSTLDLLESMAAHDVKTIVFSSSCAVYGEPEALPFVETHPRKPVNPYGMTELMMEQIMADFDRAYGVKYAALRYVNAAGADPDGGIGEWHVPETHLIPLVLDVAVDRRENVGIFGTDYDTPDGTCIRDYVHVNDLADAHLRALEYLSAGGESDAFNLGNGNGFSVRDIIRVAERVTGKTIPVVETRRRPGDPARLVGSAEKAKRVLGWTPRFDDIETIVATAWDWHQYMDLHIL